jgi:8-oxo-dGTP pyrophosphatase MutT (NUDIX family)
MDYWKPNTTVAALIERDGELLMIEEHTPEGVRLNQPAGHLDQGETLQQAAVREALEETGWTVEPVALQGVYMSRYAHAASGTDVTYLRHVFVCRALAHDPARALDTGIVRALWMSPQAILAAADRHRSPLVARTVLDWQAGRRFPLDLIWTHPSALAAPIAAAPAATLRAAGDPSQSEP